MNIKIQSCKVIPRKEQVRGPGHNNPKSGVVEGLPALLPGNTVSFLMFIRKSRVYYIKQQKEKKEMYQMCLILSLCV